MRFGMIFLAALFSLASNAGLSEVEKSSLRFHLENLRNEVELLVRNRKSDVLDVQRQEREFSLHQVYERIPLEPQLKELKKELRASAARQGISLSEVKIQRGHPARSKTPKEIFTDRRRIKLPDNELVETLPILLAGEGAPEKTGKSLRQWIHSWPDELLRLVELKAILFLSQTALEKWEIQAQAFRFRKIEYPHLKPRNPLSLLPGWARQNPTAFAQKEPHLWQLVTEIQEWTKKSPAAYENRRNFFLNDERMSFFLRKTQLDRPRSDSQPKRPVK